MRLVHARLVLAPRINLKELSLWFSLIFGDQIATFRGFIHFILSCCSHRRCLSLSATGTRRWGSVLLVGRSDFVEFCCPCDYGRPFPEAVGFKLGLKFRFVQQNSTKSLRPTRR